MVGAVRHPRLRDGFAWNRRDRHRRGSRGCGQRRPPRHRDTGAQPAVDPGPFPGGTRWSTGSALIGKVVVALCAFLPRQFGDGVHDLIGEDTSGLGRGEVVEPGGKIHGGSETYLERAWTWQVCADG